MTRIRTKVYKRKMKTLIQTRIRTRATYKRAHLKRRGEVLTRGERDESQDRHRRFDDDKLQRGLLRQAEKGSVPPYVGKAAQRPRVWDLATTSTGRGDEKERGERDFFCICEIIRGGVQDAIGEGGGGG